MFQRDWDFGAVLLFGRSTTLPLLSKPESERKRPPEDIISDIRRNTHAFQTIPNYFRNEYWYIKIQVELYQEATAAGFPDKALINCGRDELLKLMSKHEFNKPIDAHLAKAKEEWSKVSSSPQTNTGFRSSRSLLP